MQDEDKKDENEETKSHLEGKGEVMSGWWQFSLVEKFMLWSWTSHFGVLGRKLKRFVDP